MRKIKKRNDYFERPKIGQVFWELWRAIDERVTKTHNKKLVEVLWERLKILSNRWNATDERNTNKGKECETSSPSNNLFKNIINTNHLSHEAAD